MERENFKAMNRVGILHPREYHLSQHTYDITEELFDLGVLKNVNISLNLRKSDGTNLLDINWRKQAESIIHPKQSENIDQDFL